MLSFSDFVGLGSIAYLHQMGIKNAIQNSTQVQIHLSEKQRIESWNRHYSELKTLHGKDVADKWAYEVYELECIQLEEKKKEQKRRQMQDAAAAAEFTDSIWTFTKVLIFLTISLSLGFYFFPDNAIIAVSFVPLLPLIYFTIKLISNPYYIPLIIGGSIGLGLIILVGIILSDIIYGT